MGDHIWAEGDKAGDHWRLGEQVARGVLQLYVETFGSLEPLLAGTHLAGAAGWLLHDGARGISPTTLAALSSRAVNRLAALGTDEPDQDRLRAVDWRVLIYSLASARTLREAVEHAIECFEAIDYRCGRMSLRARGDSAEIALDAPRALPSSVERLLGLYAIAEIHGLFRVVIGQALPLRHIWLKLGGVALDSLDLNELPAPLTRNASWTGFSFDAAYLDFPVMVTVDDLDAQTLRSFLFRREGDTGRSEAVADQVRRQAMRALRETQRLPTFEEIVNAVGVSPATLRRRLAREGVTYRVIRDSCRRELALDLLRRSEAPIEEIAARLDFCDSDAFRRAFREWFGSAPSEYRRRGSGPTSPS